MQGESKGTGTVPVLIVVAAAAVAECFVVIALSSFICPGTRPARTLPPAVPVSVSTRPMRTSTFDIHLNLHYFLSLFISLLLLLFTVIPILISTALCMGFFPFSLILPLSLTVFLCPLPFAGTALFSFKLCLGFCCCSSSFFFIPTSVVTCRVPRHTNRFHFFGFPSPLPLSLLPCSMQLPL